MAKVLLIGKDSVNVYKTLELGCFDGMVSYSLRKKGKNATAIDINSQRFDERAIREGVIFKKMDASSLEFPSDSFDCVFSFNAFEHFTNPALVLQEAARVTMKGGYVYSNFGPIYTSPYGLHTYRSIPIPYCQFLFPDEILDCVRAQKGVKPLAEHKKELNMLSLIDYRLIWKNCSNQLKRMYYQEVIDDSHLNLVKEYPNCFKSKTRYFDNLRVSSIEILFKKVK